MIDNIKAATTKLIESNQKLVAEARINQNKVRSLKIKIEVMFFLVAFMLAYFVVLTTLTTDKLDKTSFEQKTSRFEKEFAKIAESKLERKDLADLEKRMANIEQTLKLNNQQLSGYIKSNDLTVEELTNTINTQNASLLASLKNMETQVANSESNLKGKFSDELNNISRETVTLASEIKSIIASQKENEQLVKKQIDRVQSLTMIQESLGILNKKILEMEADFSKITASQHQPQHGPLPMPQLQTQIPANTTLTVNPVTTK